MTSRYQQHKIHDHDIKVDTATIPASKSAHNLGIIFDNNVCMDEHVKHICQTVYFHIRNVNSVRKFYQVKQQPPLSRHFLLLALTVEIPFQLVSLNVNTPQTATGSKCSCSHSDKDKEI